MLRRLEKGLNTAKLKQSDSSLSTVFPADPRTPQAENTQFGGLQSSDAYGSAGNFLVLPEYSFSLKTYYHRRICRFKRQFTHC
jgi:hypothetical protein